MKTTDLWKIVQGIGPCFIGEYRGSLLEKVRWVDKTDGKANEFVKGGHLFEFGTGGAVQSITIDQTYPNTIKEIQDVIPPFIRGQRYLLRLRKLETDRRSLKGTLDPMFEPVVIPEA